ncbi:hypothetical protein JZ751_021103 [Albula glossodonta]|uniref:Uncharacterized protein n=1 Tax=Albula glossodonta TaxID=121402 RepID=A0A8T2PK67_9TELE|nr:hypothetical protein JZ751_021103 [Albula glossodonta]
MTEGTGADSSPIGGAGCSPPPSNSPHHNLKSQGLWVILGMLSFLILEKMFPDQDGADDSRTQYPSRLNASKSKSSHRAALICSTFQIHLYDFSRANSASSYVLWLSVTLNALRQFRLQRSRAGETRQCLAPAPIQLSMKISTGFRLVTGLYPVMEFLLTSFSNPVLNQRKVLERLDLTTSEHQPEGISTCTILNAQSSSSCAQTSNPLEKWLANNIGLSTQKPKVAPQQQTEKIKTSGYLNLLANCIDNFTHGLAVAGSFLVSRKTRSDVARTDVTRRATSRLICSPDNVNGAVSCDGTGMLGARTTMEECSKPAGPSWEFNRMRGRDDVGDFAILLRAGFDRWSAAKMQLSTALGGVLGACFALCAQSPKGAGEPLAASASSLGLIAQRSGGILIRPGAIAL